MRIEMHQLTRLIQLEEICTKVAELYQGDISGLSKEIIEKAFNLQSKKKRRLILEQGKPPVEKVKTPRKPKTAK